MGCASSLAASILSIDLVKVVWEDFRRLFYEKKSRMAKFKTWTVSKLSDWAQFFTCHLFYRRHCGARLRLSRGILKDPVVPKRETADWLDLWIHSDLYERASETMRLSAHRTIFFRFALCCVLFYFWRFAWMLNGSCCVQALWEWNSCEHPLYGLSLSFVCILLPQVSDTIFWNLIQNRTGFFYFLDMLFLLQFHRTSFFTYFFVLYRVKLWKKWNNFYYIESIRICMEQNEQILEDFHHSIWPCIWDAFPIYHTRRHSVSCSDEKKN